MSDVTKLLGLPYNRLAEEAIILNCLFNPARQASAMYQLGPKDFADQFCRAAFEAMCALRDEEEAINALSVHDMLQKEHGGVYARRMEEFISTTCYSTPFEEDFASWVRIVLRDSAARRAVVACEKVAAFARETTADAGEIKAYAAEEFEAVDGSEAEGFVDAGEALDSVIATALMGSSGEATGLMTGFASLDAILDGVRPQNLAILAARPGIGKTALALNVARNAAKAGTPVLFFSLEMSAAEIYSRLISMEAGAPLKGLCYEGEGSDMGSVLEGAREALASLPLHVNDSAVMTLGQIRAIASRKVSELRREGDCTPLVVVDYLQLVRGSAAAETRAVEVGEVSRGLKALAKDLEIPVLALSQLNRAIEARATKKPQLSDLRESGAIEQDADIVMFLDRSVDEEEAADGFRPGLGEARVIVAKHRNGECGTTSLTFDGPTTSFKDNYVPGSFVLEHDGGLYAYN